MPDDRLSRGTEEDTSQTRPAMRGNHNQVNVTFFCHTNNLGSCLTMNYELLDVESRTFVTLGEFRQFALG